MFAIIQLVRSKLIKLFIKYFKETTKFCGSAIVWVYWAFNSCLLNMLEFFWMEVFFIDLLETICCYVLNWCLLLYRCLVFIGNLSFESLWFHIERSIIFFPLNCFRVNMMSMIRWENLYQGFQLMLASIRAINQWRKLFVKSTVLGKGEVILSFIETKSEKGVVFKFSFDAVNHFFRVYGDLIKFIKLMKENDLENL